MFRSSSQKGGLIVEIQAAAIADDIDVASLLRKAKVAASKLKQADASRWIDSELDGYKGQYDELPAYRQLHGILRVKNPYRGLQPFIIDEPDIEELVTRMPVFEGIATLQKVLRNHQEGPLIYNIPSGHRKILMNSMKIPLEPVLLISPSQFENILNQVTSMILNWSLELEAEGIVGEGMTFKPEDSAKATAVTNNIITQNVGQIGNNNDNALTHISQRSHGTQNVDQRKLHDFLQQAIPASNMLPEDIREDVKRKLDEVQNSESPEQQGGILRSIKAVLEGASGNLAASGMLQLLTSVFA